MPSRPTRTVALTAGWTVAAVLAVGGGLLAIGEVGDGIVANQAEPLSHQQIADRLAAAQTAPSTAGTGGPRDPGAVPVVLGSPGGTVLAECAGSSAIVRSSTPGPGYSVHEGVEIEDDGRAKVEFRAENDDEVEVEVGCETGRPVAHVTIDDD